MLLNPGRNDDHAANLACDEASRSGSARDGTGSAEHLQQGRVTEDLGVARIMHEVRQ
jgi:hypothetical protein